MPTMWALPDFWAKEWRDAISKNDKKTAEK
jgi:hypothetical protein